MTHLHPLFAQILALQDLMLASEQRGPVRVKHASCRYCGDTGERGEGGGGCSWCTPQDIGSDELVGQIEEY
jgi:hypothetical protein